MSFREIIDQRVRERQSRFASANDNVREECFASEFFGIESVRNLPTCLDLRLADGTCRTISYMRAPESSFDPSIGIDIITSNVRVKILGRNLLPLYRYLASYRVSYIQANMGMDFGEEENIFITSIEIENL